MYVPVALVGVLAMRNLPPDEGQYEETNVRQMMTLPVLVLGTVPQRKNFNKYNSPI